MEVPDQTLQEASPTINAALKHNRASFTGSVDSLNYPEVAELYWKLCAAAGPVVHAALVDDLPRRLTENAITIHELQRDMKIQQQKLSSAEQELDCIRHSPLFQLRARYHRILDRVLPVSSRRRRVYETVVHGTIHLLVGERRPPL